MNPVKTLDWIRHENEYVDLSKYSKSEVESTIQLPLERFDTWVFQLEKTEEGNYHYQGRDKTFITIWYSITI